MTTNNLISTPQITGNIGSCTSQTTSAHSGRTVFKEYYTNIVTNSCTGETQTFQNWEFSGVAITCMMLPFAVIFTYLFFMAGHYANKTFK